MSAYGARQMTLLADPIDVEFAEFHHRNRWVYDALVRLARQWVTAGNGRCSIALLTEIVRWEVATGSETGGLLTSNHVIHRGLPASNPPDVGHKACRNRAENVSETRAEFTINNSFRSRYARLIMANEPDLVGLFETRQLRTTCREDQ